MPYTITRYQLIIDPDGKFPFTIADNTVDTSHTSLDLVGKGTTNYGQIIADNMVWQLENYAGPNTPSNPTTGQTWYDTVNTVLRVYNPAVSTVAGSPWANVGSFASNQNQITTVIINGNVVLETILNGVITAIWSGVTFVPNPTIPGFPTIYAGLNLNNSLSPLPVFNGVATVQQGYFVLNASGIFVTPNTTVPSTLFKMTLTGGGGAGSSLGSGGGGGAAATCVYYVGNLPASTTYSITIGTGGTSGGPGNASLATIGTTTLTANGGFGAGTSSAGAAGGIAVNGTLNLAGGWGESQFAGPRAGSGGTSYWGAGAGPDTAGINPGSGGGGYQSSGGGSGANGIFVVEW